MVAKKGEPWKRMIRDFKITGTNDLRDKEQTKTEMIKTHQTFRMFMGAKRIMVADWLGAYRQVGLRRKDWRLHCYADFGLLFMDTRLPFGRSDSAMDLLYIYI